MDINESVMVPHLNETSDLQSSTMGGKHQRNLSLSAKWAGDKAMAIEYLRRQREVMTWMESVLKRKLPTTDLFEALKSGVVLREMMETLFPDASNCMSPISRSYSMRMAPWKERENISVFLRQCKSIGMNDLSLFCTDDLYEGTNMVQVLFCVQHFMMFSEERVGHHNKPIENSEPAMFSNQELEMAMSKLEQAGVDVKAFPGLLSSNTPSVQPESIVSQNKEDMARASEVVILSPKAEKSKTSKEEERIKNEESVDGKTSAEMPLEVCNQMSEATLDIENLADEDDLNPAQESGSDAGDVEDDIQAEEDPVTEKDPDMIEVVSGNDIKMVDEETLAVIHTVAVTETTAIIQQVLSALVNEIEMEPRTQLVLEQLHDNPAIDAESSDENIQASEGVERTEDTRETVSDVNIEIEVTEQPENFDANSSDVPVEPPPAEEVESTQGMAEPVEEQEHKEDVPQPVEDEELEAKSMSKCTCGRCTIM
ncbi:Calponin [Plasmopara halstedii]|uniref:Calponin n=1 Tax=Plasmopara halstedii TaxID=4781 RepID=A0A0P1AI85_PLAHL|nr:Calponin [Plasmopara halstedii]CEG40893.1 Calponin [Plasmopara halstedii]|eukprot:XP_024577262.1 Calponin [Plasmopara halstedii]